MGARQTGSNRVVDPKLADVLAVRVSTLRMDAGLSQEALGQAAGISTLQVVRIETRRANPTLATLSGLAEALRTTVAALVADGPPDPSRRRL